MTDKIALIGAGAMGSAIGARLVATGTRLAQLPPPLLPMQQVERKRSFCP
jgi:ketopantoate reductase